MKKRLTMIIACILTLALLAPAYASEALTARLEGNTLKVTWNVRCSGDCILTIYQNKWPISVLNAACFDGSASIPVNPSGGKLSVRLKTSEGCYTSDVKMPSASHDGKETEVETAKPTESNTATPKPQPTDKPETPSTTAPVETEKPETPSTTAPVVTEKPQNTPSPTQPPKDPVKTSSPTKAPQATQKPTSSISVRSDLAEQVVRLVNEERSRNGLGVLRVDAELSRAAQVRAAEIIQSFSHTRPNGSSWSTVSGSAFGENIAKGQRTADKVMASWMTSEGHRANILRASYGSIGVCVAVSGGVVYWVQLFGR